MTVVAIATAAAVAAATATTATATSTTIIASTATATATAVAAIVAAAAAIARSKKESGDDSTQRGRVYRPAFAELRSAYGETFRLVLLLLASGCWLPTGRVDCSLLSVCRAASRALGFHRREFARRAAKRTRRVFVEDRQSRRESTELYAATKIEDSSKERKIYIYIHIIYIYICRRWGKSRDTIRGGSPWGFREIGRAKEAAERGRHAEGFRIVNYIEDTPGESLYRDLFVQRARFIS